MTKVLARLVILTLIICVSGTASAQDANKKKNRNAGDLSPKRQSAARVFNKKILGQLELSDQQKTEIGQVLRQSQAEFQKLRQELTGATRDPETAAARKQLIKQLKEEGKTKQEIMLAVRQEFASQEKPTLDPDAKKQMQKSLQEMRATVSEKINAILSDSQRENLQQLMQDQRGNRSQGKLQQRKRGKNRDKAKDGIDDGGNKKDRGGDDHP